MLRAFKIATKVHSDPDSFVVYIAENAGKAKTMVISALLEAYDSATYSWIASCRRAPEYDYLADKGPGCVAWQIVDRYNGNEQWQIDK